MNPIFTSGAQVASTTSVRYYPINMGVSFGAQVTESVASGLMPIPGVAKNYFWNLNRGMTANNGWNLNLVVNGNVTSVGGTVSVAGASILGNTTDGVRISAGDRISHLASLIGLPPQGSVKAVFNFIPDDDRKLIVPVIGGNVNVAGPFSYFNLAGASARNNLELAESIIPMDCTLTDFETYLREGPGASTAVFTGIMRNGSIITATQGSISGNTTTFRPSNLSVALSAGDKIAIRTSTLGTPVNPMFKYGLAMIPSRNNVGMIFGTALTTLTARFHSFIGESTGNATEATRNTDYTIPWPMTISSMWVTSQNPPGGTTAKRFSYRRNGADVLSTSLVGTQTIGNNTTQTATYQYGNTMAFNASTVSGVVVTSSCYSWSAVVEYPKIHQSGPVLGVGN